MSGPLKGIRVLDLTRHIPGPFTTHLLTRLGATVIKVEAENAGSYDVLRIFPPYVKYSGPKDNEHSARDSTAIFEALNVGKKGLSLDVKSDKGRETLMKMAKNIDVVVDSSQRGLMQKLQLDYASFSKVNPRIIYCNISGFGVSGDPAYANRPTHDLNLMALSGLLDVSGPNIPGHAPPTIGFPAAAITGSLNAVIGT